LENEGGASRAKPTKSKAKAKGKDKKKTKRKRGRSGTGDNTSSAISAFSLFAQERKAPALAQMRAVAEEAQAQAQVEVQGQGQGQGNGNPDIACNSDLTSTSALSGVLAQQWAQLQDSEKLEYCERARSLRRRKRREERRKRRKSQGEVAGGEEQKMREQEAKGLKKQRALLKVREYCEVIRSKEQAGMAERMLEAFYCGGGGGSGGSGSHDGDGNHDNSNTSVADQSAAGVDDGHGQQEKEKRRKWIPAALALASPSQSPSQSRSQSPSTSSEGTAGSADSNNEGLRASALVGRRVRVYFDGDHTYYEADVIGHNQAANTHTLLYLLDGEETEEELLPTGDWQLLGALMDEAKATADSGTAADGAEPGDDEKFIREAEQQEAEAEEETKKKTQEAIKATDKLPSSPAAIVAPPAPAKPLSNRQLRKGDRIAYNYNQTDPAKPHWYLAVLTSGTCDCHAHHHCCCHYCH
jgi:hypothetical protein